VVQFDGATTEELEDAWVVIVKGEEGGRLGVKSEEAL
jgi:hypothetical protein